MIGHKKVSTLAVVALMGGLIALPSTLHAASERSSQGHARPPHDMIQGPHVEGHIAFMHAELRITPAQENLWAPVAQAMRDDVTKLQEAETRDGANPDADQTAVQYLQNRSMFAELRAQGETRFLKAFMPLYENMSADQKAMADELIIQHTQN